MNDEFNTMNDDIRYLDQLDLLNGMGKWKERIAYLLGQYGIAPEQRLAPFENEHLEEAWEELSTFSYQSAGNVKRLLKHAADRLGEMIAQLVNSPPADDT